MGSQKKHPNASSPVDKIVSRALKAVKKIETQIIRLHEMTASEKIKYFNSHRYSSFCTIRTPEGREISIGLIAERQFDELCEILNLFSPDLSKRISHGELKKGIKTAFHKQYIVQKSSIDKHSIKTMLEQASSALSTQLETHEHHIPCVFFIEPSPETFYVGAVKFTRVGSFVAALIGTPSKDIDEHIISQRDRSIEYYEKYPWVATVTIEQCGYKNSLKNAIFVCETALNVLRVLFGRERTKWVRLSTSKGDGLTAAHIWSTNNSEIKYSLSSRASSPPGPTNWYDFLHGEQSLEIISVLGSVIEHSRNFKAHSELTSRLLDAINWFGDACLEPSPAAAILKYVTCIERLYFGVSQPDMKKKFASRVSKILSDFECESADNLINRAHDIYDVRSTLVHGGVSQREDECDWPLEQAEMIARDCILSSCQMYIMLSDAFDPKTASEVESALQVYEKKGIEWCVSEAHGKRYRG